MTASKDVKDEQKALKIFERSYVRLGIATVPLMAVAKAAEAKMPASGAVEHVEKLQAMLNDLNTQARATHEAMEKAAIDAQLAFQASGGTDKENFWDILPRALGF